MTAYDILGLPDGASQDEVKRAYRRLALQYHPDRNAAAGAHERFIEITEAYEEIMEGRVRRRKTDAAPDFYTEYFSRESIRRRESRERAERYARMRYEEFKAETDAFKSSRYYFLVVFLVFLFSGAGICAGAALAVLPLAYALIRHNFAVIILEIISIPFGIAFIIGSRDIFNAMRPYMRQRGELWHKPDLSLKALAALLDIRLRPFRPSAYTFMKLFNIYIFCYCMLAVTDFMLPYKRSQEVITTIDNTSITRVLTQHFKIKTAHELEYLQAGDTLFISYSRILKVPGNVYLSPGVADRLALNEGPYPARQTIFALYFILPLLVAIIALFGFLSDINGEISGSFVTVLILSIMGIAFFM